MGSKESTKVYCLSSPETVAVPSETYLGAAAGLPRLAEESICWNLANAFFGGSARGNTRRPEVTSETMKWRGNIANGTKQNAPKLRDKLNMCLFFNACAIALPVFDFTLLSSGQSVQATVQTEGCALTSLSVVRVERGNTKRICHFGYLFLSVSKQD